MVGQSHKLTDYKHLSAPMWVDYSEQTTAQKHKKDGIKMASNRFSQKELDRIKELTAPVGKEAFKMAFAKTQDIDEALKAQEYAIEMHEAKAIETVLSERDVKIDRDALRAFVQVELTNAKTPATDKLFKALVAIDAALKNAETEQTELAQVITTAVSAKFGQDAANLLKVAGRAAYASVENGNRNMYDKLSIVVPERKEIVHAPDYKRPVGFSMNTAFDVSTLSEKQTKLYKALCIIGPDPKDGLYHNAQMRLAYEKAHGETRDTNFNMLGECPAFKPVFKEDKEIALAAIMEKHVEKMIELTK